MSVAGIHRRSFPAGLLLCACLVVGTLGLGAPLLGAGTAHAQSEKFTAWGWPQPYEKVSEKSVEWLKRKGWWPLQVAFQSPGHIQRRLSLVAERLADLECRAVERDLRR